MIDSNRWPKLTLVKRPRSLQQQRTQACGFSEDDENVAVHRLINERAERKKLKGETNVH